MKDGTIIILTVAVLETLVLSHWLHADPDPCPLVLVSMSFQKTEKKEATMSWAPCEFEWLQDKAATS